MTDHQAPPTLGNQYDDDRVLRSYLRRALPAEVHAAIEDELYTMGALGGDELYALQQSDRRREPVLTQWNAWGERIDRIDTTHVWQRAEQLAAEYGLVATAYEQTHGAYSRLHQFALAHLFIPSTDIYGCPLAMTDGAARTLLASGNEALIEHAIPHLTSRDPALFWTSGQWMTELPGGSDVSRSTTTAQQDADGTWRLYGRKWFTSAVTAPMALVLARPEGNPEGSEGLALFFVELRDADGRLRHIRVNRLKDKLGTRKLPTAELTLEGTPAVPVDGLTHGTRHIAPMLNITRTWNAVTAVAYMRRGLALARDYARKRQAFGRLLADQPLHVDTLAGLQVEYEAAFHLTFRVAQLLGQSEAKGLVQQEAFLLRLLTPLTKLTTARQAVAVTSEVLEAFGGAGYVEDTGLPVLLRDVQVLPIWEGTTNVLALDALRVLHHQADGLASLQAEAERCLSMLQEPSLIQSANVVRQALQHADTWLAQAALDRDVLESGTRRLALTLGRATALALLLHHAQWALDHEDDARPAAAARRFATHGVDCVVRLDLDDSFALANDMALPAATPSSSAT